MKVETQGSVGAQNTLTFEEIGRADAVIIAADAFVDKTRFAGKRLYETSTKAALHEGQEVVKKALALPEPGGTDLADLAKEMKKARAAKVTGPYKHLMTGVSYMLPIVVAGGILIALAFAFGGIKPEGYPEGTLAWALMKIGGGTAFALFVPVLAAFIAYSIADRPGIAPGIIGGMLATSRGVRVPGRPRGRFPGRLPDPGAEHLHQAAEEPARPEARPDPAAALHADRRPGHGLRHRPADESGQ